MASFSTQARNCWLLLLFLHCLFCTRGSAQDANCSAATEQPVFSGVDPPAGTSTITYTIFGELLSQVVAITITIDGVDVPPNIMSRNASEIQFTFGTLPTPVSSPVIANVSLQPNSSDCETLSRTVSLHRFPAVNLVTVQAQPGTVIHTTPGTCLPDVCSDNSTDYNITVGAVQLERLNVSSEIPSSEGFVARFPNFDMAAVRMRAPMVIITQYQEFNPLRPIDLLLPGSITDIRPRQGQRGTTVVITGSRLLGENSEVNGVEVRLGDTVANVTQRSDTNIRIIANSGIPGNINGTTVRINTTQTFRVGTTDLSFDGPYTYLADAWTQLEDGVVANIIPLAAQPGKNVTLCGDRLLGGGATIDRVTIAGQTVTEFFLIPFTPTDNLSSAGSECINIELPSVQIPDRGISGIATLVADTGAIVDSNQTFSYAEIRSVSPMQGQFGTLVTITGVSLLSGYDSEIPEVYLSGVRANVWSSNSTTIVVQAQMPPEMDQGSGSSMDLQPNIFGVRGPVEIVVDSPFSITFNVSIDLAWTHERPGEITNIDPAFGQFGTRITIQGENLLGYGTNISRATLNDTDAIIVEASNDTVVLIAPDSNLVGLVSIVLISDTGAVIRGEDLFEYRQQGTITAASPSSGQNGTYVTITGTNLFGHGNNITDVSFLGIPASIDYSQISNTMIRVRVNSNNNTVDTPASIRMVADTSAIVESNGSVWTYLVEGQVSNVMPAQGQIGTRVVVVGTNLLGGGSNISEIFLDGVQGMVVNASSTSVTVVMDAIETQRTGFFAGQVYIVADTGAVVTGGRYQHRESGVITDFSPQQGREGTRIVLTGTNLLGYGSDILGVDIAGFAGTIGASSTTQVTVRAGAGSSSNTGPIQLMIDTGAIVSSTQNFTYEQSGVITSVDPPQGAEGIGILVRGEALRSSMTRVTSITIGGSPVARIVTESETEISIIAGPAPQMNPNNAEINITASDGSFVSGQSFSYQNLTISLPNIDRGQEGTLVDISLPSNLSSFDPSFDLRATIDDQTAQIVRINQTERSISVMAPRARRAGTYTVDVAVENIERLVARLRDGFTYLPEGVIFRATPDFGQRGTSVVLEGENLLGGGDFIASATLAGVPAAVRSNTSESIELEILENPDETAVAFPYLGDIVLRADTNAVIRRLGGFTLLRPGEIFMITPDTGQFGTRVSIVGSGLLQNTSSANITTVSLAGQIVSTLGDPTDSQITVQAADAPGGVNGTVEVTLTSGARITSDPDITFRYLERGQITSVTPGNGTVGTQVEIVGTNLLGGGTNVTDVFLDGVNATIDSFSPTSITVTTREGTSGAAGNVEIITETGANVTGIGQWTYEDLGTITSVDPPVGQQGVEVRVAGVSLLGGSGRVPNCSLADIPAEVISFSDELVICRAGFNLSPRSGIVRLTADTGPVITSNSNLTFTYYGASFDRIEPTNGTNGTYVNISGINLFGFPGANFSVQNVMFGSVDVTEIITITDHDIRVRVGASNATSNDTVRVISTSGAFLELEDAWSYIEPGEVNSIEPEFGFPGDTITISGENLVPPCVPGVRVILGQTESFTATIINTSAVEFRPGIYQEGTVMGSNLDNPQQALPVQIIASNGATVYTDVVNFRYNATGEITLVNPDAGGIGSEVTITGQNLLNDGSVSQVMLAGVPVNQIVNATDTEVTVIARTGPDMGSSGSVVIESDNGRLTGIAGNVWTYFPVIRASDVSPQTGQNGTLVSINVARIPVIYNVEQVALAGVPSSPSSNSTVTEVRRAGPSNDTQVGNITIEYGGGNSGLGATITIVDAWRYEPPVQISSVSPGQGYFNTSVVITGSNFQAGGVMVTQVYLANILTSIESQSDTELQVRIAEMRDSSSGLLTGPIVIESQNGAIFTSQMTFTYVKVSVGAVVPQLGQQGTRVRIQGVGLLAGGTSITSLTLGGIEANVSSRTDNDISVIAAMSPTETNISDISYTVNTEAVVQIPNRWQYVPPGVITGVSPSEGNRGTVVTVTGSRMFGGGDRATMVLLNNIPASEILVNDENLVQVVAGASEIALSPGTVRVIANTGAFIESQVSMASFTYLEPGNVTFDPPQGQNGTRVTLSGLRFHNGEGVRRVTLAGVESTIEDTPTSTSVTVRAGRPSRLVSFEGPVRIESEFGTITESETNFTYLEEGLVLSVIPARGQNGTMVYIEGERLFGGGGRAQSMYLAGVEAAIADMSSVRLNVTAGEQTNAITGDIVIVSDTGAYVRRINGWTYAQQGVITSIDPPQGQYGTKITISGERLFSGGDNVEQVLIDGVLAFQITSINESTVCARAGEPQNGGPFSGNVTQNGVAFSGNVTLVSNFGGRLESDVEWNYLNQSTITNVSPLNGTSNTTVTVTGTNLLGGGTRILRVLAADIEAMNIVEAESETEVVFTTGFNLNGMEVLGNITLESDTGALTIIENGWRYENECPSGFFGTVDNCTSCDPECAMCFGPEDTDCSLCNNFRIVLANSGMRCVGQCPNVSTLDLECRDACELNQFARINSTGNTIFCYNCSSLCDPNLSCSGPEPTQCGGCANFFDTSSQACVQMCPVGTFSNESNSCVPCNSQCVAATGCFGPTAAECNQCDNVQISATLTDSTTTTPGDICLERCPVEFFVDVNSFCQPCSSECAGNCAGPTPFDCIDCRNFSVVYPNNTRQCVPTCNPDPNRLTMYSDTSGRCQMCSSRCSVQGGCRGPSARDCIGCAFSPDNTTRLPTLEGECVLFCNLSYYNDAATRECQSCDDSCEDGCTGPRPQDCIVPPPTVEPLAAGPGTIAVFVVISFFLLLIIVLLVACLIWRVSKRTKYTLDEERIEFEERYTPRVHPPAATETTFSPAESKKEKIVEKPKATGATNGGAFVPEDGLELYTEMGPEETDSKKVAYKEVIKQHLIKDQRSEALTGSQDLYTDMEPSPAELPAPARPPKPEQKPPAMAPALLTRAEKKPPPPLPPPEKEAPPRPPTPEVYTDMEASVQEVIINPGTDEEYSEMAPSEGMVDEYYEDAGSVRPPLSSPVHPPQAKRSSIADEKAPLLDQYSSTEPPVDDALYEDTETAAIAADHYKRISTSTLPPALPSRPVPKKRPSDPLPPTPLQKSLQISTAPKPPPEDLYMEPEAPVEESLYEAIPGHERLIADPPPSSHRRGGKPSNTLPLPPKSK